MSVSATTSRTPANRRERRHPELIGVGAAAKYCDVYPSTIRRWITAGRLNAYRVGPRLIKIDLAELDKIMRPVGAGWS
jgi:excisionase family DNA binding protein